MVSNGLQLLFKVPSIQDVAIMSSNNVISSQQPLISGYPNIEEILSDNESSLQH